MAGCSGSDVSSILSKMKEDVTRFEIDVDAEIADEHPKVYTKIHLKYRNNKLLLLKEIKTSQRISYIHKTLTVSISL